MRRWAWLAVCLACLSCSPGEQGQPSGESDQNDKAGERADAAGDGKVAKWGRLVRFASSASLKIEGDPDPYDPDEVRVDLSVSCPDGTKKTWPAFWFVPHEPFYVTGSTESGDKEGKWERYRPTGKGRWCVRISPQQAGVHTYVWQVTRKDRSWAVPGGEFECVDDPKRLGPITVGSGSLYFRRVSGGPFIPIGQNLCWPEENGTVNYGMWLRRLSEAGANCARLWLVHYMCGTAVEWSSKEVHPPYQGVGKYSQEASARVDSILNTADSLGIAVILSFYSFGDTNWDWKNNPYSFHAGGWLTHPTEFFTDERARRHTRNRLRYAIARYGWFNSLWAWELWNEVETSHGYVEDAVTRWHEEMAAFVRQTDPHGRLITTSYRFVPPTTPCLAYRNTNIDFVNVHTYLPDITLLFSSRVDSLASFGKPVVISEFGLDVSPTYFEADKTGLHVHDGLWAGVFSGSAGGGMTWWWERYIHPKNLCFHYTGISRFLKGEDLRGVRSCTVSVDPPGSCFGFALRTETGLLAWAGTKRNIGRESGDDRGKVISYSCVRNGGPVTLVIAGDWSRLKNVVIYDTYDGLPVSEGEWIASADNVRVKIPSVRHDVAIKGFYDTKDVPRFERGDVTPIHDHFEGLQ